LLCSEKGEEEEDDVVSLVEDWVADVGAGVVVIGDDVGDVVVVSTKPSSVGLDVTVGILVMGWGVVGALSVGVSVGGGGREGVPVGSAVNGWDGPADGEAEIVGYPVGVWVGTMDGEAVISLWHVVSSS